MGLVDYSDSEGSDAEVKQEKQKTAKPSTSTLKSAFQKVVDRSNPHKIRVNLPEQVKETVEDSKHEDEPPAKRAKTGGGAFGGFNSFLPAPKRAGAVAEVTGAKRNGLSSGRSLKTGAAPAFTREPQPEATEHLETEWNTDGGTRPEQFGEEAQNDITNKGQELHQTTNGSDQEKAQGEPKKKASTTMFKPLSVARKPQKKKPTVHSEAAANPSEQNTPPAQPKSIPKISLFSTEVQPSDRSNGQNRSNAPYQPLLYTTPTPPFESTSPPAADPDPPASQPPPPEPQSLTSIASDLNLSPSATRQLLGRRHPSHTNPSAIKITNFSTDVEYAANEILRQQGEKTTHTAVRAIAPGKHSLKQLVSAASNQKEALEEQFASGRRNRKEAGGRYAW